MIIQSEKLVEKPKVSVVIVTYNQAQYIEKTIDSVLSQKCDFPIEIIVADDGSNDGERDILINLQEKHTDCLRLLFNETNMMVTKNYFNSFMEARGQYIAPLDGDDFWVDEYKLSKQVEILERNKDVSVVHTGYQKFYEETGIIESFNAWESPLKDNYGRSQLTNVLDQKFTFFPVVSSILFRTQEIKDYRQRAKKIIDASNAPGEGMPLFTHFTMKGKFSFMNDVTTVYRIRKSSVSHIVENSKQINFRLRYAFQKINIAEFYNLNAYAIKRSLLLINSYIYIHNDELEEIFLVELAELTKAENSPCIRRSKDVILFLSKHRFIKRLLFSILSIKNRIRKYICK